MKDIVATLLEEALQSIVAAQGLDPVDATVQIENTRDPAHGDLASNVALANARHFKIPPRALAEQLCAALPKNDVIERTEIAGPGFINVFLSKESQGSVLRDILRAGTRFGHSDIGAGRRVQVEFVSANPTGPLHVGHGRGAAVGDSLARILEANDDFVTPT